MGLGCQDRRLTNDKLPFSFSCKFEDAAGRQSELQVLDGEAGALYWNYLRSTNGDESMALAKVRQNCFDEFTKQELHFIIGTTQQFHAVAPNPWVIVGLLRIPPEPRNSGCCDEKPRRGPLRSCDGHLP